MLDLLGIASLSFIAALSGAIVPGPVFALVVSESLRAGKIAGPLIVLGHFIIEWIIIFMIFLGLGPVLDSKDTRIIVGFV
ncbi:MAG: LysE family transporter, partial [Candidatus Bathyarchaeia archaeon]